MAITVGNTAEDGAVATTLTYSLNNDKGTDNVVIVTVSARNAPTDVTYNAVAMTLAHDQDNSNASASMWYLVDADTGANDVVVSGLSFSRVYSGAIVLNGVDQSTVIGAAGGAAGDSHSETTTEDNSMVIGTFSGYQGAVPTGATGTEYANGTSASSSPSVLSSSYIAKATAGSQTMAYTASNTQEATTVVEFLEAAPAATTDKFFLMF